MKVPEDLLIGSCTIRDCHCYLRILNILLNHSKAW
ncbi:hypothetical protein X975_24172, partial [Stegodyphus mimosarum]